MAKRDNDLKRSIQDPGQPWWWRKVVGPAMDRVNDNLTTNNDISSDYLPRGDQWCRFRRDGKCFLPRELDVEGTRQAGYNVWIPYNRGRCPRVERQAQKECEVSEPGPDSRERMTAPDATYTWAQGGQRYNRSYQG